MSTTTTAPVIQLQGIGKLAAIPVSEMTVGMRTCWNFGYTYDVVSITPKGSQSVTVELRNTKDGRLWTKTMRLSRLIVAYWPRK